MSADGRVVQIASGLDRPALRRHDREYMACLRSELMSAMSINSLQYTKCALMFSGPYDFLNLSELSRTVALLLIHMTSQMRCVKHYIVVRDV